MKDHLHPEFGVGHLHKPFQLPHPPIYVPSISRSSPGLTRAAERGFRFISHHMIHADAPAKSSGDRTPQAAAAGRGGPRPRKTGPWPGIFSWPIPPSEARRLARGNSLGACIQYILDLTRATAPSGVAMWKRDAQQSDADCSLDYFLDDVVLAGDPEEVTRQLLELRDQIGPFGTLVLTAHDWDDRAHGFAAWSCLPAKSCRRTTKPSERWSPAFRRLRYSPSCT